MAVSEIIRPARNHSYSQNIRSSTVIQILPITDAQPTPGGVQQPAGKERQSVARRHVNTHGQQQQQHVSQHGAKASAVLELLLHGATAVTRHTRAPSPAVWPGTPKPGAPPPQRASSGPCPERQHTCAPRPTCTRAAAGAATSYTGHHRQPETLTINTSIAFSPCSAPTRPAAAARCKGFTQGYRSTTAATGQAAAAGPRPLRCTTAAFGRS
jgi:hypothetical protein